MLRNFALVLLGMVLLSPAYGQDRPKRKGILEILRFKTPEIDHASPDTSTFDFDATMPDPEIELEVEVGPDLKKAPHILEEDSVITGYERMPSLVEIAEELKIDCVWITSQEYYAIWDSYSIDPYQVDGAKFTDTLNLQLINVESDLNWSPPLHEMRITSNFGMRSYRWHYGTDLKLNTGDPVMATFDGIVRISKYDPRGYGNYIVLRHYNGLETLYGHMSEKHVQIGQEVKAGDTIGLGGSTGRSSGPHLHYEVRYAGNAIDPQDMYDFETLQLKTDTLMVSPKSFAYLKEARQVVYHRVRSGDTLSGIGKRYGLSAVALARMNGIRTNSILKIGQRLRVR